MSWWRPKKHPKKQRGECDRRGSHQHSEPLSQHHSQQTVPNIVIGDEPTPANQLEQRKWSESHKKTKVPIKHRASTTSTESEGYGSREASTSSLPHIRSSLSSLQGIPEESKQGTETSPKALHKNMSTASVCSGSSTSSYHTVTSNTRHSPTKYLEHAQLPSEAHSQKVRLDKLEARCQENREELERRIAELEDRVKMLESRRNVVSLSHEDSGENNKNALPVNVPVSQDVIIALAKRIPRWKFLARYLDFKEHEIQRIQDEHQGDVQEQCFQMLWTWKQMHPYGGDYLTLWEAVRKDLGDPFYSDFVKLLIENEEDYQCTPPC